MSKFSFFLFRHLICIIYRDGRSSVKVGGGGWVCKREREARVCTGESGDILPQKILKSRGSEMVFSALSILFTCFFFE